MPAKPKSPFPDPAAKLPGEADILATVLADLSDLNAKLVYADWLEERDDPRGPLLREFITAYRAGKKLPAVKAAPQPWRDLVGITMIEKAAGTALASKTDALLALARSAICFKLAKASEQSLPVGASKLGGRPDMPADAAWPKFEGELLSFLGQFNLADLQASPVARELPAGGLLSVFCLYDEEVSAEDFPAGAWRVLHFPGLSELVRREFDGELSEVARSANCRLAFVEALGLPDLDSPWRKELLRIVPFKNDDDHTYRNFIDGLMPGDNLLGYPSTMRGDVLGKKSVRHLLTLGDNDDWGWIDGDMMHFTLSERDLKQGRFDRVKMTLQNY